MSKHLTDEQINELKEAHLKWVERARQIVDSGSIHGMNTPVDHEHCDFGKMIHSGLLDGVDEFIKEEIETSHFLIHNTYENIYALFDGKEELNETEKQQAHDIFEILEEVSHELINSLQKLK